MTAARHAHFPAYVAAAGAGGDADEKAEAEPSQEPTYKGYVMPVAPADAPASRRKEATVYLEDFLRERAAQLARIEYVVQVLQLQRVPGRKRYVQHKSQRCLVD